MNHTPKISFDGCGLNDANDPYKRRLFTAEDRDESRRIGMYIEQACNAHEELVQALQGVLHHNAAVKPAYQLPESLVRQITKALTTIEKGA